MKKTLPINVLDLLGETEYSLNCTNFSSPISGHDAKLEKPLNRLLMLIIDSNYLTQHWEMERVLHLTVQWGIYIKNSLS